MTGPEYVAAVVAFSMAVICFTAGLAQFYGWRKRRLQAASKCPDCMGRGFTNVTAEDGRLTGARWHCQCRQSFNAR